MVCVIASNDAFVRALNSVESRNGIGVTKDGAKFHVVLGCANPRHAFVDTATVESMAEIEECVSRFASRCERIDLPVFLNERIEGERVAYRRQWVLVDVKTLMPRLVGGSPIESPYNPT